MRILSSNGLETRRIILLRLRGQTAEVLIGSERTDRLLPQVEIPRWQRIAESLTAALKQSCGIDSVSVSSLEARPAKPGSEQITYEIMAPHGTWEEVPRDMRWEPLHSLAEHDFHDRGDFHAVRQAVAQTIASGGVGCLGPFARLGWFEELEQWVRKEIATEGLRLNGRFRQLNAYPNFSLIRFETDGPAVWFKAVGWPNQQEYPLTLALARLFPRFLPTVISTRPDWNGWLAFESEGPLLCESSMVSSRQTAAEDLAKIQTQSIGAISDLLNAGAHDLRATALLGLVEPFFTGMAELMELQTKAPPQPLSREELRRLSDRVREALIILEESPLPMTLGHLDINPGNIVCRISGCVFLDWAETFVGHPFLTFEYFREHFRRAPGYDRSQETELVAHYSSPWSAFTSAGDLARAFEFSALVAAFAFAARSNAWRDPQSPEASRTAGHLRSLTRRMEREARLLPERRFLWSSC